MDLSQLSSNLPANDEEKILSEFKNAAFAVTKLYKQATATTRAARRQGYLEALQDLLSVLDSGADPQAWALAKMAEDVEDATLPGHGLNKGKSSAAHVSRASNGSHEAAANEHEDSGRECGADGAGAAGSHGPSDVTSAVGSDRHDSTSAHTGPRHKARPDFASVVVDSDESCDVPFTFRSSLALPSSNEHIGLKRTHLTAAHVSPETKKKKVRDEAAAGALA